MLLQLLQMPREVTPHPNPKANPNPNPSANP